MKKRVKYLSLVFAAAVCISLSACSASEGETNSINSSSDNTDGLFNSSPDAEPPEDAEYSDYSMYEGLWLSDEESLYPNTYIQFDAEGNWTLTKDGETTDEGNLKYNADEGEVIVYSKRGGAIDGGIAGMSEEDRFYISTFGYFNYLDGRGGQWQGDGDSNWDGEDR